MRNITDIKIIRRRKRKKISTEIHNQIPVPKPLVVLIKLTITRRSEEANKTKKTH